MIIYVIENQVNGKKYIGQTVTDLDCRFRRGHLSEARTGRRNSALYNAIRKYGEDNFKASVLDECSSQKELNEREKYWIKKLDTLSPYGYNILEGGDSKTHKQETRDKISKTRRQQFAEGMVPGFTGKTHSAETRQILAEKSRGNTSAKGSIRSDEYRDKQRIAQSDKKLSEETKRRIGYAVRGEKNPNFGKRGAETSRYGVIVSEETRQKLRDAWVRRKQNVRGEN